MPRHIYGGQRAVCRSWLSPSTRWFWELNSDNRFDCKPLYCWAISLVNKSPLVFVFCFYPGTTKSTLSISIIQFKEQTLLTQKCHIWITQPHRLLPGRPWEVILVPWAEGVFPLTGVGRWGALTVLLRGLSVQRKWETPLSHPNTCLPEGNRKHTAIVGVIIAPCWTSLLALSPSNFL